jgi:hypothetical protein
MIVTAIILAFVVFLDFLPSLQAWLDEAHWRREIGVRTR